jgi:hypothetical protein
MMKQRCSPHGGQEGERERERERARYTLQSHTPSVLVPPTWSNLIRNKITKFSSSSLRRYKEVEKLSFNNQRNKYLMGIL